MTEYLLFDASRGNDFDDMSGNTARSDATLGQHLDYIFGYGGTPDFYDSVEAESYGEMKREVAQIKKNTGMDFYVVDMDKERVVWSAITQSRENDGGMEP